MENNNYPIITDRVIAKNDMAKFLINQNTSFSINESYKAARTNLFFLTAGKSYKKIVFTSPSPNEGKTITCINMGITFAQTGLKILILDADLRKPKVHRYFKTSLHPGLSNKLAGFTESSCICQTPYKNLYVMTAGQIPPNPAELLASSNMKDLLEEYTHSFDYIFIDSPPVNIVTDVAVLSRFTDGVILLARQNETTIDAMDMAVKSLKLVDANILGFFINDVDKDKYSYKYRYKAKGRYGSKYSGYRYYYRSKSSDEQEELKE